MKFGEWTLRRDERTVDVHIKRLRENSRTSPNSRLLRSGDSVIRRNGTYEAFSLNSDEIYVRLCTGILLIACIAAMLLASGFCKIYF